MRDKYDSMTPEQVAAATLAMMGYHEEDTEVAGRDNWVNDTNDTSWCAWDIFDTPRNSHLFAAEVKGWMMEQRDKHGRCKWDMLDDWDSEKETGCVEFMAETVLGTSTYDAMAEHPRAVCIAGRRAKEAESDAG